MTFTASSSRANDAVINDELQANDRTFDVVGLHTPGELQPHLLTAGTAVIVIDIVRCTNTANAIVAAGAKNLYIVVKRDGDDIDDLVHDYEAILGDGLPLISGGEKHGKPIPGVLFGNSALDVPADMSGANGLFFDHRWSGGRGRYRARAGHDPRHPQQPCRTVTNLNHG